MAASPAGAGNSPDASDAVTARTPARWRLEFKRQNTARGTPEESTKTTGKIERLLDGPVSLLRLEVPFPDEKDDFSGSPLNPRLGDVKARLGFRAFEAGGLRFPSFVELSFPTADPESLGSGRYQLSAGIRMLVPLTLPFANAAAHQSQGEIQIEQVNAFGGDGSRDDINRTKFEFILSDVWRQQYTGKLKLKPTLDWVRAGDGGAVFEVEGGMRFARVWRTWLMLGHRVWGDEGVGGTYSKRVEIGIDRTF